MTSIIPAPQCLQSRGLARGRIVIFGIRPTRPETGRRQIGGRLTGFVKRRIREAVRASLSR
jgi:hypothetical protein